MLYDDLGKKLFNSENIHQTFKLVFHLISECFTNSGASSAGRSWILAHSVDLFCDLCEKPSVIASLLRYPQLRQSLADTVGYLESCTAPSAFKLLQLLGTLASASSSPPPLPPHAKSLPQQQGPTSIAWLLAETLATQQTLSVVVQWCCHARGGYSPSLWGLKLLEILVLQISPGDEGAVCMHFTEVCETMCRDLVAAAGVVTGGGNSSDGGRSHVGSSSKINDAALAQIISTVSVMASSHALRGNVRACVHSQTCNALIDSRTTRASAAPASNPSAALVVATALQLLARTDGAAAVAVHLKRKDVLRAVGRCFANADQSGIDIAIRLIMSAACFESGASAGGERGGGGGGGGDAAAATVAGTPRFDTVMLTDGISRTLLATLSGSAHGGSAAAPNGAALPTGATASSASAAVPPPTSTFDRAGIDGPGVGVGVGVGGLFPMTISEFGTPHQTPLRPYRDGGGGSSRGAGAGAGSDAGDDDGAIDPNALADRLVRGLQLKDLRSSEILTIYESKFQDMSKTQREQATMIDSKTAALHQADALLAEYRSKSQSMGGQFQEMRVLVHAAEKRSEHATAATAQQKQQSESLQWENQQLETTLAQTGVDLAQAQRDLTELAGVTVAHTALQGLASDLKAELGKRDSSCALQAVQIHELDAQLVEAGMLCNELKGAMQQQTAVLAQQRHESTAVKEQLAETQSELAAVDDAREAAAKRADAAEAALLAKAAEMEEAAARIKQLEGVAAMIHNLSLGVTSAAPPQPPC